MPSKYPRPLIFELTVTAQLVKLPRAHREALMEEFLVEVADTLREELKLETPVRLRMTGW